MVPCMGAPVSFAAAEMVIVVTAPFPLPDVGLIVNALLLQDALQLVDIEFAEVTSTVFEPPRLEMVTAGGLARREEA